MPPNQPPFAVPPTEFRFPALAALAGRAQLGGDREVALAVYLAARLAHDCHASAGVGEAGRAERATGAKNWLSTLTLPPTVKAPLLHLIERTAGDTASIADDLKTLVASARTYLDIQSQGELDRLAASLAGNSQPAR